MAAGENRFAPELNEKEVIELLENATPRKKKQILKVICWSLWKDISPLYDHFSMFWIRDDYELPLYIEFGVVDRLPLCLDQPNHRGWQWNWLSDVCEMDRNRKICLLRSRVYNILRRSYCSNYCSLFANYQEFKSVETHVGGRTTTSEKAAASSSTKSCCNENLLINC